MLHFSQLCIERPLGTKGNAIDLPFDCTVWQSNDSFVEQNGRKKTIFPSPFSKELKGSFSSMYVTTIEELQNIKRYDGILIFDNSLSKTGRMPKNFPFYFPNEDKLLYDTLEKIQPKGIITITGQDPASGLHPFPIFQDVNLEIPTISA